MSNQQTYEDPEIVNYYFGHTELQPPEQSIVNLLRERLPHMKMLDIGVGAGRTTLHFGRLVREYVGIDYSENMVQACKERFSDDVSNISFHVGDVRSLDMFGDSEFDFILFSFNGLDSITHDDRLRALKEIYRVGKSGSIFCFSTHNLYYARHLFGIWRQLTWKPRTMLKRMNNWYAVTFVHNDPRHVLNMRKLPYAVFDDGAHGYRLQHYYITPSAQVEQLSGNFENVRIFKSDGSEVGCETRLESVQDWWLYFLCTMKEKRVAVYDR
jgi:ubiquinone/menaquinone biosynthesis C-methylase UbiE